MVWLGCKLPYKTGTIVSEVLHRAASSKACQLSLRQMLCLMPYLWCAALDVPG